MQFEWDEDKREQNLRKHNIDFRDAIAIWSGYHMELPSNQCVHGEDRYLAIGESNGRIITVVFTRRKDRKRLISARNARRNEKENYQSEIG